MKTRTISIELITPMCEHCLVELKCGFVPGDMQTIYFVCPVPSCGYHVTAHADHPIIFNREIVKQ